MRTPVYTQRFLLHEELVAAGSLGTDWCKCVIEQFTSAYRYTRCVNERKERHEKLYNYLNN
ncbi:hypothetical protein HUJ04_001005 [Dendroctonus ponderosae]|nr:hypothetical protein HUJ04_001005 [Dendroctonus ponderosae]